ncbi:MAG: hypothetical protein JWM85_1168 [Acidimicrobiaceae bacterium]|nr:hypothetical protein [Acidimicrobiaceae bacterium]
MQPSGQSNLASYVHRLEASLERILFGQAALVHQPELAGWLVRDALEKGDTARAESLVAQTEQLAADLPGKGGLSTALVHVHGLLERDPALLDAAAASYPEPADRAAAAEDAAVAWDECGEPKAAEAELGRAREGYFKVGAEEDVARVEARLRALAVRRPEQRASRPSFGWNSLTATEERVLDLVAEGLTNRQVAKQLFLSRHTVDFHLRQIFRKLDVSSRVQLTRLALERRLVAG